MKKAFQILKNRPTLDLKLTRDSVCAADDCDAPHEKTISVHSFLDPVALISHVSTGYLPSIGGVGHSWDCVLNGRMIGTISQDGIKPRVREVEYEAMNALHFVYHSASY